MAPNCEEASQAPVVPATRAVTERPAQPGREVITWAETVVFGGVTTRPASVGQLVSVPLGTSTALRVAEAEAPGARVIVPLLAPLRVAWITWLPELLAPATPGKPPVTQLADDVFLKSRGAMTWPAAPWLCPTVMLSIELLH